MWPEARFQGASLLEQRERDGIFVTADAVNVIEVTASRDKAKAKKDGEKLRTATQALSRKYPYRSIKGWFITLHEPTADQRDVIRRLGTPAVVALSFSQFRSLLVDASAYLTARSQYPFGSARGLAEGSTDPGPYIDLDIAVSHRSSELWDVDRILTELISGTRSVLLGDYGAGKSMTLRECFLRLAARYRDGATEFPIYLNLRDHWGQNRASEALTRHAENVGFESPAQLVRAWRSGYAVVLLDGFDELASVNWVGRSDRLKEARRRAVQLVRTFVEESPAHVGIAIAGRQHYFDSEDERLEALGLPPSAPQLILNDFTAEQVGRYLKHQGWQGQIPEWLPARPLLLGYLAARRLLQEVLEVDGAVTPAAGWDELLERICHREARIEAGLSGNTVRQIIERVATYARDTSSGLGPLDDEQIHQAFTQVTGVAPDEAALVLLQRLPGLGVISMNDAAGPVNGADLGGRGFIDDSLADVARSGDTLSLARDPFNIAPGVDPLNWQVLLGPLGVEVLALRWIRSAAQEALLGVSIRRALEQSWVGLASDLVRLVLSLGAHVDLSGIYVADVWIPELDLADSQGGLAGVEFQSCVIQTIRLEPGSDPHDLPRFINCNVGLIEGLASHAELPPGVFDGGTEIDEFGEPAQTTSAYLDLPLPLPTRVALTILKKLYLQRGMGRREAALYRGLDDAGRRYVADVVDILSQEGLMVLSRAAAERIWLPVRGEAHRVRRLLAAPTGSTDSALARTGTLKP